MEELDIDWIKNFENNEKEYENFYEKKVNSIKIFSLYVNNNCILDKVKETTILLNNSLLEKDKLIKIIRETKIDENINYKLISILKFNIDLKSNEIKNFLLNNDKYYFLESIKELKNIYFDDTIAILQSLNSLYFIYYEYNKKLKNNKTKKVFLTLQPSKSLRKTKKK